MTLRQTFRRYAAGEIDFADLAAAVAAAAPAPDHGTQDPDDDRFLTDDRPGFEPGTIEDVSWAEARGLITFEQATRLLTGGDAGPKVQRHLAGQHNQKSHGRWSKGSGSIDTPARETDRSINSEHEQATLQVGLLKELPMEEVRVQMKLAGYEDWQIDQMRDAGTLHDTLFAERGAQVLKMKSARDIAGQIAEDKWKEIMGSDLMPEVPMGADGSKQNVFDALSGEVADQYVLVQDVSDGTLRAYDVANDPQSYENWLDSSVRTTDLMSAISTDGGDITDSSQYTNREAIRRGFLRAEKGANATPMLRERAVSDQIATWAGTSNDTNMKALSMQRAVRDEFGLADAEPWGPMRRDRLMAVGVDRAYRNMGDGQRAIARATYENTQRRLSEQGMREATLFRGMRVPEGHRYLDNLQPRRRLPPSGRGDVDLRPLSSFTVDESTANSFAHSDAGTVGFVMSGTIAAERIFSMPGTGFGAHREQEWVVLAGPDDEEWDLTG